MSQGTFSRMMLIPRKYNLCRELFFFDKELKGACFGVYQCIRFTKYNSANYCSHLWLPEYQNPNSYW